MYSLKYFSYASYLYVYLDWFIAYKNIYKIAFSLYSNKEAYEVKKNNIGKILV